MLIGLQSWIELTGKARPNNWLTA